MADSVFVSPFNITVSRREFDKIRATVAEYNRTFPATLTPLPPKAWPKDLIAGMNAVPIGAWRSNALIAVLYSEGPFKRLSVCRAKLADNGHYEDGLTWDELQRAKAECGFAESWMVETFPPVGELVNVANMRHLWLLPAAPAFAWRERPVAVTA